MIKKSTFLASALALTFSVSVNAQVHVEGTYSTGATHSTGATAPAGYTWSELQPPSNTLGSGGIYNTAGTTNLRLANDFVVPAGETWNVSKISVFGYQTGYNGATVPIDALRLQIWDGDPSLPSSTIVAGNLTTNVLAASSGEAKVYRVSSTSTATDRRIWKFDATITATLPAGTYWIDYQVHAKNDGSVFFPPVTIPGMTTNPAWNSKQHSGTAWGPLEDSGTFSSIDLPFEVNYSLQLATNESQMNATRIYPNPVKDILNIESNGKKANSIEIYDMTGALVSQQMINAKVNKLNVNVSTLVKGAYIVKLIGADKAVIYTGKMIKE